MIIKEMSQEQRPRERLERFGSDSLSEAELLAIILNTGTKNENVIDMSHRLISTYGVDKLASCSLKELQEIKGIGKAKACRIHAMFTLSKRIKAGEIMNKIFTNSKDVAEYYIEKMKDYKKEHLIAVLLDSKNKMIKEETISIGTLDSSLVHPREVFKEAIKNSAKSIILIHNHPSGDSNPSVEDEKITKLMMKAGELMDIKLLDHLVIGKDRYETIMD